ncbi:hypothetical protein FB45DRAFT_1053813 [Roridomyces roridus]|uniref:C2H2-type domain-containing protein n=1 Tax=Roridomyces roridus TaxID=1738132 RepID=A0AAD7C774_9AGAR|nr:hypothetical protein FB45DRAFT_1053813 [Roridomyces roridus]
MVLQSRTGATTDRERLARRVNDNPELVKVFTNGLEGTYHFKMLTIPTLQQHDNVRNKWRGFVEYKNDLNAENGNTDNDLQPEIDRGIKLPSEGVCKEFVTYLGNSLKGLLDDYASRRTVRLYVSTFFACWRRYAGVHIPKELRMQVDAYISSPEFIQTTPVTRNIREKPIASEADFDDTCRQVWNDTNIFRLHRSKVQFIAINAIGCLTGERVGAIIESSCYRKSGETLDWKDIGIHIVPNPDDPSRPFVLLSLRFRNTKAHRGDPQYEKTLWVLMEPVGSRATCLVTLILYLALADGVFEDGVETIEQIVCPKVPPTEKYTLRFKKEALKKHVFRSEEMNEAGIWVTSETKALSAGTHNDHLRRVSMFCGFTINITMHNWRRGSGNRFSKVMDSLDRDALLSHTFNSNMFRNAYQARDLVHDLGGILHDRPANQAGVNVIRSATGMKKVTGLPVKLDVAERAAIEAEPELVAMMADLDKIRSDIADLVSTSKITEDEDVLDDLTRTLEAKRKARSQLQSKYYGIVASEVRVRLKAKQVQWIDGHARRQLNGEPVPPSLIPDRTRESVAPRAARVVGSDLQVSTTSFVSKIELVDPINRLCDALYRYAEDDLAEEVCGAVSALLGTPDRLFPKCYVGESPTAEAKCPVCKIDCGPQAFSKGSSQTVGSHIHRCLQRAQQEEAQRLTEQDFEHQHCQWAGCRNRRFKTREAFVEHMQEHGIWLLLPTTPEIPHRSCQMLDEDGEICGEEDSEDWYKHFGQVHGMNIRDQVEIHFCAQTSQWFVDTAGDGLAWEDHNWQLFDNHYAPFSKRLENSSVDFTPIGVVFSVAKQKPTIDYATGSDYQGKLPEFSGDVRYGVATKPHRCPWCIFAVDESMPIEERMRQFITNKVYADHIGVHVHELDQHDDEEQLCPVPSCGTHKFSKHDLKYHLVTFHRVPVMGTSHAISCRRLFLPVPPDEMDVDDEPTATRRMVMCDARSERITKDKQAISGHCYGCSRIKADIGKHIEGTSSCRQTNRYQLVVQGVRTGETLNWDLSLTAEPVSTSKSNKPHVCGGACRRQYEDISVHYLDKTTKCKPTFFRMALPRTKDGNGKWKKNFGPPIDIKEWIEAKTKQPRSR